MIIYQIISCRQSIIMRLKLLMIKIKDVTVTWYIKDMYYINHGNTCLFYQYFNNNPLLLQKKVPHRSLIQNSNFYEKKNPDIISQLNNINLVSVDATTTNTFCSKSKSSLFALLCRLPTIV